MGNADALTVVLDGRSDRVRPTVGGAGLDPGAACACVGCPHSVNCRCRCLLCPLDDAVNALLAAEAARCAEIINGDPLLPVATKARLVAAMTAAPSTVGRAAVQLPQKGQTPP